MSPIHVNTIAISDASYSYDSANMQAFVRWFAVTAVLLQLLACHTTALIATDGMPPGKSKGDHVCIHDKVRPGSYCFQSIYSCTGLRVNL